MITKQTPSKKRVTKKIEYYQVPKKWRPLLHDYVVEHVQSGYTLSAREFCRNNKVTQGSGKRYLTNYLRDWCIKTLLHIKRFDDITENAMNRVSLEESKAGIYGEFFK